MNIFIRVIIAVVALALAFALIPPVLDITDLNLSGSALQILKIACVGAALVYVWKGRP